MDRSGQLSPALEKPDWYIKSDCLIPRNLLDIVSRTYSTFEIFYWLPQADPLISPDEVKKFYISELFDWTVQN